jgi:hypothetical protein
VNGNARAGEPSLTRDAVRAPLVQRAFHLAASGRYSLADVLRMVTSLRLVTHKGLPLTAQTLGTLLRNQIYTGTFDAKGFGLRAVPGDFEALISGALFQ